MKKRIFALALALCMMVSVMPNSFAAGILSVGDGTSTDTTVPSGGSILSVGGNTSTQLTNTGSTQQTGILSNGSSAQPLDDGTGETVEEPVDNPVVIDTVTYSGASEIKITGTGDRASKPSGWRVTHPAVGNVNDPLFTNKTVEWDNTNKRFNVRLESYVTGSYETKTTTTVETDPLDVILILDRSSRMTTDKMSKLKEAANSFLTQLQQNSPNSRVALISYANEGDSSVDTNKTTNATQGTANHTALVKITASNTVNSVLTGAITGLGTAGSGNAYSDEAFEKAVQIFQSLTTYEASADVEDCDSERMVIFFTAGIPGISGRAWDYYNNTSQNYPAYDIAQRSIHYSVYLKTTEGYSVNIGTQSFWDGNDFSKNSYTTVADKGCGASVYCVGIDLDNCPLNCSLGGANAHTRVCAGSQTNEYMYRISSHRIDGTHLFGQNDSRGKVQNEWERLPYISSSAFYNRSNDGWSGWNRWYKDELTRGNAPNSEVNSEKKYYLAGGIDNVAGMLSQTISTTITREGGPDVDLTADAILKDVISPYFKLSGAVTIKTAEYTLSGAFVNETTVNTSLQDSPKATIDGKTINVSGFNYGENWCGTNMNEGTAERHGQMLIVEFSIVPEAGFMGGNNVPTNGYTSGVYANGSATTPLEHFTYPLVNVEIAEPVMDVNDDRVIYYGETAPDVDDLYNLPTEDDNWDNDAWKYNFVELTYTVPNGIDNDACDTYEFKLDIKPIAEATTNVGVANSMDAISDVATVKVHVLEAVLTAKDDTIYLGKTTDLNKLVSHVWECDCDKNDGKVSRADTTTDPEVDYQFSGVASTVENAYAPADNDCETITVSSSHSNDANDSDTFIVHVVEPKAAFQDSTIYLGYVPVQNDTQNDFETYNIKGETTWVHTKDDGTAQASGDQPKVTYDFATNSDYTDCATVKATVYSNGVKNSQTNETFMVHVLRPSLDVTDGYIYQGQTKTLTDCVTLGDTWADKESCTAEGTVIGDKPEKSAFDFGFNQDTDFGPMKCDDVKVATATIGGKNALSYFAKVDFTVHVLKPVFAVTANDLWADCGETINLYSTDKVDAVSVVTYGWAYTRDCGDTAHNADLKNIKEPGITVNEVVFNPATHTMTAADATAVVTGLTYTNDKISGQQSATVDSGDVTVTYPNDAAFVTLHVNKFDLTINKTWDGAAIYQQDAIFNLYHTVIVEENGESVEKDILVTKVVMPAGQANVKVTGLLCGQTYTVIEDTGWTWRWNSEEAEQEFTGDSHDVSTEDPHKEMADAKHTEDVSFINSLAKRLWLSFCTFVQNIFTVTTTKKGGIF